MEKILLEIVGLSYTESQSKAYALILGEKGSKRRIPILIGSYEAQSIVLKLENIKPSRPGTHDLFHTFAETFGIRLVEIIINDFSEGIFYSKLICNSADTLFEIDSRTSDAVALALRFNCPIYAFENVLEKTSILLDFEENKEDADTKEELSEDVEHDVKFNDLFITEKELQDMLVKAIEEEDYEKASVIRDELKKRELAKKRRNK
jgi:bifunctional DNase/RNase